MKKIKTLLALACFFAGSLICNSSFAQAPQKFSYQTVVRNASQGLVQNQSCGIKISIRSGSASGVVVYSETHTKTSNINGLVTLDIGAGTVASGTFNTIDWGANTYFVQTQIDPSGSTNYTIDGTSQLLSVPYALHAKTAESITNGTPIYNVGDFAQGGIVFWVDETGQHGLVAAKTDQASNARWYAGYYGNTYSRGDGPYSGEINTAIIIASHAAIGDDSITYAARICNELQVTEAGKTYGDWYLPSKEELILMHQNKALINNTALANGGGAFDNGANSFYYSSTEIDANTVWYVYFTGGTVGPFDKDSAGLGFGYVRAIRAF